VAKEQLNAPGASRSAGKSESPWFAAAGRNDGQVRRRRSRSGVKTGPHRAGAEHLRRAAMVGPVHRRSRRLNGRNRTLLEASAKFGPLTRSRHRHRT
jgi:hypothetical protein